MLLILIVSFLFKPVLQRLLVVTFTYGVMMDTHFICIVDREWCINVIIKILNIDSMILEKLCYKVSIAETTAKVTLTAMLNFYQYSLHLQPTWNPSIQLFVACEFNRLMKYPLIQAFQTLHRNPRSLPLVLRPLPLVL